MRSISPVITEGDDLVFCRRCRIRGFTVREDGFWPKAPLADGASDIVLLGESNPEKPVEMGNVTLGASAAPNKRPMELLSAGGSLANIASEPNRPPFALAFETSLAEEVGFEPARPRDKALDTSLLGDTLLKSEKIAVVDEELVVPNEVLLGGLSVDALLLLKGAEFELNILLPRVFILF